MSGAGLGGSVGLIAVAEGSPAGQPRQPASELGAIFVEQVCRKLVDRDYDYKPRRSFRQSDLRLLRRGSDE